MSLRSAHLPAGVCLLALLLQFSDSAQAGRDVVLGRNGEFRGRVLTDAGLPVPGSAVMVNSGQAKFHVRTDAQGNFVVPGLKGGVVEVHSVHGAETYRGWSFDSAPPASENAAFLRPDRPGNRGGRGFENRVLHSEHNFENHPSLTAPLRPMSP